MRAACEYVSNMSGASNATYLYIVVLWYMLDEHKNVSQKGAIAPNHPPPNPYSPNNVCVCVCARERKHEIDLVLLFNLCKCECVCVCVRSRRLDLHVRLAFLCGTPTSG